MRELSVEEVAAQETGAIKIGPFGSALPRSAMVQDGIKVYGQENLIAGDWTIGDRRITPETFQALRTCELHAGDVVIGMMGSLGHCEVFPSDAEPGLMDSHLLRIQTNGALVTPDYLRVALLSSETVRQISRLSHGSIMAGLSSKVVRGVRLNIPPLEEQRRIAEILDTIDETIQTTERVIAKLMSMSDGLRESHFGQLVSTCETRTIHECFEMTLGKMLSPASKTNSSPFPYLANRNVQWDRCSLDDVDEMDFTPEERVRLSLKTGDVLVCEGGEVGRTAIWHGELENCYFQKAIHRLRTRGRIKPAFMLHYMKYASTAGLLAMYTSQTSIAHLTAEKLAFLRVPLPSIEEQEEVIHSLASFSSRRDVEECRLSKYRGIRAGLATDLLSGRVRTVPA